jgi:choline dehydrogenase-like flavoprotein
VNSLSCDVLIVGAGAAGATLAATIAERSQLSVILLEKGGYFGTEFFNQRELDMTVLLADNGGRTTVDGAIPVAGGQCVGGGTTVNYALSFDPVPQVWQSWRERYGLTGFSLDPAASDYGIGGLNLATAASDVRQRCSIHEPADSEINDNNVLFAAGCRRLGISVRKFRLNMRGCIGCGFCGQGCAYDAKRGTLVTYVPDALARGVRLVHHCAADKIELQSSSNGLHAAGVTGTVVPTMRGSRPNSVPPGPVAIDAKLVILSAGAIESPALLQRSAIPDSYDLLGRGLILHPSLPIAGVFKKPISNYRGITGSYYSDYFYPEKGFMLECLFDHPIDAAIALPGFGLEHFDLMRAYDRLAGFGAMLVDTVSPQNRVSWDPQTSRANIAYRLNEPDKRRLRYAAERMVEIIFAAGAQEAILTTSEPITPGGNGRFRRPAEAALCERLEFVRNQTLVSSAHAQASVKMSEDPRLGVLDSRGEVRGVRGLVVCDSSAFPTSCGANPMVAIMSMARYQGIRIAAEWTRYDS